MFWKILRRSIFYNLSGREEFYQRATTNPVTYFAAPVAYSYFYCVISVVERFKRHLVLKSVQNTNHISINILLMFLSNIIAFRYLSVICNRLQRTCINYLIELTNYQPSNCITNRYFGCLLLFYGKIH